MSTQKSELQKKKEEILADLNRQKAKHAALEQELQAEEANAIALTLHVATDALSVANGVIQAGSVALSIIQDIENSRKETDGIKKEKEDIGLSAALEVERREAMNEAPSKTKIEEVAGTLEALNQLKGVSRPIGAAADFLADFVEKNGLAKTKIPHPKES